jgi:hypothetical protein
MVGKGKEKKKVTVAISHVNERILSADDLCLYYTGPPQPSFCGVREFAQLRGKSSIDSQFLRSWIPPNDFCDEENVSSFTAVRDFLIIKLTRCTNFSNLFWKENQHVSDSSSVHQQELFTAHSAMVYVIQVCRQFSSSSSMFHPAAAQKLSTNLYDIYHC